MASKYDEIKIGNQFSHWTVVGLPIRDKKHRRHIPVKCKCGVEKTVSADHLVDGGSQSCGCEQYNLFLTRAANTPDLGTVFDKLTVIEHLGAHPDGGTLVKCQCACGNVKNVRSRYLYNGSTGSCGCKHKERDNDKHVKYREPGEAGLRVVYSRYKAGAKNRNYSFNISYETFKLLSQLNCWYCNKPPSTKCVPKSGNRNSTILISNGTIHYNGIDRQDNNIGYELTNIVPCCSLCNRIKNVLSADEFLEHLSRILNHQSANRGAS